MWITNAGFADVFIVFAKVDGEAFTAFIVERGFPGVSTGEEEHKMGLHGSSTAPVILQDARVPAGNVLGEIGRGHKVAFNVLNYGRFKLGAATAGGAQAALAEAVAYAAERRQFGQPIASFGAIRTKLATMAVRIYALESLLFRTAGLIDRAVDAGDGHAGGAPARGARGVRDRGVDRQGRRQRDRRLRRRRERADPRRQRLRQRLPGRAALPRRARQPHLRGHQRDQPAADRRACWRGAPPRATSALIAAAKRLADEVTGPLAGDGGDDAPLGPRPAAPSPG